MAYGLEGITKVESWTATDELGDDITLDGVVTACMTNGTLPDQCDEWKEGTLNVRVEIDLGIPPGAVTALKVRFYFSECHTAGTNSLYPYTDENSVSGNYPINKAYGVEEAGDWVEHICSANFLSELGDLGDKFAVRLASPDIAKSKLGEVEIDITYTTYPIAGITKDKDGVALPSCEVSLFKTIAGSPPTYDFVESQVSHGTTGAYSFEVASGVEHFVYAIKDGTPHVFDTTDNVLVGDEG